MSRTSALPDTHFGRLVGAPCSSVVARSVTCGSWRAPWLSAPAAFLVAGIGAVSVFKEVYINKRELKCACVGGDSKVPLGFISLTENLMMIGMGVWMLSNV